MTTRRDFIKTSAAGAGVAALAAANVHAAGNDVIKVGLIGCGGRGSGAVEQSLMADPNMKLVAVGDAFEDRAKGLVNNLQKGPHAQKVDVKDRVFVGLDAYEKVIKECDLVLLATPPGFRPIHIAAAVAAGKHIFTEKPVGVDGPGIRKVLDAYEDAKKKKLKIVAGTQRRHQTSYLESMKRVHGGEIGEIVGGQCYWNQGGLWHRKKEPGMSDLAWQIRNWLYFTWLSGDHIVEQHVHNLDVINWALGTHPVRAVGLGGRQSRVEPEFGHIFDHFATDLEYPNGVHVMSMCRQIEGSDGNISETVVGTKGTWSSARGHRITPPGKGEATWSFGRNDNKPYEQEHIDLVKAIREEKELNELKNVAESTMTAILCRMSTYTGKALTWEQALGSKEDTMPTKLSWDMSLPVPAVAIPGKTKFS